MAWGVHFVWGHFYLCEDVAWKLSTTFTDSWCLSVSQESLATSPNGGSRLPINFSTLLPVSKSKLDLNDNNAALVNQSATSAANATTPNSLPIKVPSSSKIKLSKAAVKQEQKQSLAWPGIEAIVESYSKYSQGKISFIGMPEAFFYNPNLLWYNVCAPTF